MPPPSFATSPPKRVPNQQAFKAVQDLTASNNVLKTEMQNLNLQMDEKVKQIQELNRMIANYQSRVEGSPQLEGQSLPDPRLGAAKQTYEDYHRKNESPIPPRIWKSTRPARTWKCWIPPATRRRPPNPTAPRWRPWAPESA